LDPVADIDEVLVRAYGAIGQAVQTPVYALQRATLCELDEKLRAAAVRVHAGRAQQALVLGEFEDAV
jgi:hypothetical protein